MLTLTPHGQVLWFHIQVIGKRNEISEGDVKLVKKLYNCESGSTTILNPPVALTASFTSSATVEPSTASTKRTISGTSTANTASNTSKSTGSIYQTTGKDVPFNQYWLLEPVRATLCDLFSRCPISATGFQLLGKHKKRFRRVLARLWARMCSKSDDLQRGLEPLLNLSCQERFNKQLKSWEKTFWINTKQIESLSDNLMC